MKTNKQQWWDDGFGLKVIAALQTRIGSGWEDGVVHRGGIQTGSWYVYRLTKMGRRVAAVLSLYASEADFLEDA